MPRIRTIKPDAFLSESLAEVGRGTRWTFAGLWTYADDAGRARDDARLIKAALYPLDDTVSLSDVENDLAQLTAIGAVCRYRVSGRDYLHMPNWHHQKINRPTPPKSPPCPFHEGGVSGHVRDSEDSVTTHGGLTEPSVGERKGREMEREGEGTLSRKNRREERETTPARFDEFWDTYGKKKDRKKCETAYRNALRKPGVSPDLLVAAAAAYIAWQVSEGKHPTYTKDPLTWLHGENWTDERPARHAPQTPVQGWLQLVEQTAEAEGTVHPFPGQLGGAS